jgi:4-hydroxy-L-threonine phosphate dehydrogenase PdxA
VVVVREGVRAAPAAKDVVDGLYAETVVTPKMKPRIALFIGDPAGIGPELIARLLADPDPTRRAQVLLIASRASMEAGMRAAELRYECAENSAAGDSPVLVNWKGLDAPVFPLGQATAENGRFMLEGLAVGVDLVRGGQAAALCFAPLNKSALRAGGMQHPDEMHWFAEVLAWTGPCVEFNVLDDLWTSRITSHVALKDVAGLLSVEGVAEGIELLYGGLQRAGNQRPKLAVCGLNPHNGDNGNFGREEIDIIAPGVALAGRRGYPAEGPFPADTIFVRARGGAYDGIVTMYHDQGQIAMKLMGFERGVTVQGGLPIPITTPAHGTAYDITGQGRANVGALRNAFALACRMAKRADRRTNSI